MTPKSKSNPTFHFPPQEHADKQGLLLIGGDLHPDRVLQAYQQGVFPWYEEGCPVLWWCPNPRLVLLPENFKRARSLRQSMKQPYELKIDYQFQTVMERCANSGQRKNRTWITQDMMDAYNKLHRRGYAHSFEIWRENRLIGGLYGVSLGRAFFGESMFHLERDVSKIALYELCQFCLTNAFHFIDCQLPNPHLQRLGATLIHRKEFLHRLNTALKHPSLNHAWSVDK